MASGKQVYVLGICSAFSVNAIGWQYISGKGYSNKVVNKWAHAVADLKGVWKFTRVRLNPR